jgi:hypothetical protein
MFNEIEISRRYFLGLSASLPLLAVVGPHMLLSEKPTWLGWTADYVPPPYASFSWMTVGERHLSDRDYEREVLRRQRLEQLWAMREKEVQARCPYWVEGKRHGLLVPTPT